MTKRGLIIGINYSTGPANIQLQVTGVLVRSRKRSCVNDTRTWAGILSQFGYSDVTVIAEKPGAPPTAPGQPTKRAIMGAIKNLIDSARSGDQLFFSFSGHGIQVPDYSGDEADGFDEALVPIDAFELAARGEDGYIVDDALHKALVGRLPPGVQLTVVMDCCHSGTGLDLPYVHKVSGKLSDHVVGHVLDHGGSGGGCFPLFASLGICQPHASEREVGEATLAAFRAQARPRDIFRGDPRSARAANAGFTGAPVNQSLLQSVRPRGGPGSAPPRGDVRSRSMGGAPGAGTKGRVVMFSGCLDDQTSADIGESHAASGALTFAFSQTIKLMASSGKKQTYAAILCSLRDFMRSRRYAQVPQLSSSFPLDPAVETFSL
eukprot:tig00020556_g11007.t1